MQRFTDDAQKVLSLAQEAALELGHDYVGTEHVLIGLTKVKNSVAAKALEELVKTKGVNFDPAIQGGDEVSLFRNGTLAMSLCWNSTQQNDTANGEAGKTINGDEIIPMLFPTDDGKTELCGGIWGFGIFDNGDENKVKAAKAFIRFGVQLYWKQIAFLKR